MATILICEDDAPILNLLCEVCEDLGHTTLRATSGTDAIMKAAAKPDIALIDIGLPGNISGLEVCQTFRQTAGTQNTYIVVITARAGAAAAEQSAKNAGADAFLHKPFHYQKLVDLINTALGA